MDVHAFCSGLHASCVRPPACLRGKQITLQPVFCARPLLPICTAVGFRFHWTGRCKRPSGRFRPLSIGSFRRCACTYWFSSLCTAKGRPVSATLLHNARKCLLRFAAQAVKLLFRVQAPEASGMFYMPQPLPPARLAISSRLSVPAPPYRRKST